MENYPESQHADDISTGLSHFKSQLEKLDQQNKILQESNVQLKQALDDICLEDDLIKNRFTGSDIHTNIAGFTGEEYLSKLMLKINELVHANISIISEMNEYDKMQTVCTVVDGKVQNKPLFDINSFRCIKNVKNQTSEIIHHTDDICSHSQLVDGKTMACCIACNIINPKGQITGKIISLFEKNITDSEYVHNILRISSVRAGAVIERRHYERRLLENEKILMQQNAQYQLINHELIENKKELTLKNEEYLKLNNELQEANQKLQAFNDVLNEAKKRAEESDQLKTAFLANMSHEIRTPMNGIIGFSHMLANDELDNEKKLNYVSIINSSANQLLTVISDIMDISKIEANQLDIINKPFKLSLLFNDLYEHFAIELKNEMKDDIVLEVSTPENELIMEADFVRTKQVFTYLLSNAIKFTSKGKIQFGYFVNRVNQLTFYVKDTGIGINSSDIELIFDRFRQVETTHVRNYGGTGLGLSISKGLIQKMGGEIWVESKLGVGSTFYFTMNAPFQSDTITRIHKNAEFLNNKYSMFLKNIPVLVIEDMAFTQLYIEELLLPTGALMTFTDSGKKAISLFKSVKPQIILLDIMLPDISGYDVLNEIRKISKDVIIIGQSAYAMTGDMEKAMEAGCDAYVQKPFFGKQLLATIAENYCKKNNNLRN